jgi:4-hydroxybenzoate polyprenyltransferase
MPASGAVRHDAPPLTAVVTPAASHAVPLLGALRALSWAVLTSTGHRLRRGECALLAINLSLIAYQGPAPARAALLVLVSALAMLVMYAFNDLVDAPTDWNNPKKDRALVAAWLRHRRAGVLLTCALKLGTLALAAWALGVASAAAVAAGMLVNVAYSTRAKGVPVADVATVWVWGALYAAIVGAPAAWIFLVGLMTGICHLFQALGDRAPDAASGIATTAVRSAQLSRDVLIALSGVLAATLLGLLGWVGAASAVVPLVIFFAVADAGGAGWLLTKAYFAVVWVAVLGSAGAAG